MYINIVSLIKHPRHKMLSFLIFMNPKKKYVRYNLVSRNGLSDEIRLTDYCDGPVHDSMLYTSQTFSMDMTNLTK